MTADISRHSLRPAQNFTGVVRQQGRLPIDADETESDDIAALMLRQMVAETICSRGSPDDGFMISGVTLANGLLDFAIAPGSFYLGGTRLASSGHSWSAQPDWLTISLADRAFALPPANAPRHDLVWLGGWEQTITATEDGELLEPALGGPDTSARRRTMWRANLLGNVPGTCPDAFADLVTRAFPNGTLDAGESEILSNARLTIGFTQLEPLEDLCRPNAQAGFLGARNEAFRIQLTAPGRFIWGRDNAAPLYRVQVMADANGARRKIRFLAPPRDEFGWPLAGMTVELLRWGSLLSNYEKAAEPMGVLLRVISGFDPGDDNAILVGADIDQALDDWFATPTGQAAIQPLDPATANSYFYLRVWTGGGTGNAVDNPMQLGGTVDLGDIGLTCTFASDGIPGDYWVVSARPNTPTRVLPWALLDDAPPVGPRRMIAPLALIPSTSASVGAAIDCRHHFRPLCEVGACCRVTVGDGRISFGDVLTVQEALARLPAEGGEICIHPGDYAEHVTISNRQNILITGCGAATRWGAEPGRDDPLLTIESSSGIHLRRVAMENALAEGVLADVAEQDSVALSSQITVEDVSFVVADRPAIHINGGRNHKVRRCRIILGALSRPLSEDPFIGRAAAIFLRGRDLLVEHCQITAAPFGFASRSRLPVGGIHIGGGSREIMIRDNVITRGNGHGITLGSTQFVPVDNQAVIAANPKTHYRDYIRRNLSHQAGYGKGAAAGFGLGLFITDQDCITIDGTPPGGGDVPVDVPVTPESGGLVRDIRIQRNDIGSMGFSGISAHVFSGLGRDGNSDAMAVEQIEIDHNRITGCMRNEIGEVNPLLRLFTGWGGIALSICADATMRDNLIAENGRTSREPVCGIFIAIAENVTVTRNRIQGNGARAGDEALNPGMRGGIIIGLATGGTASDGELEGDLQRRRADLPALTVSSNHVDAPNGRALRSIALGPVIVHGNRLTGAGRSAFFSDPLSAIISALLGFVISGDDIVAPRETIDLTDYLALLAITELLGGDAVNIINLCMAEDVLSLKDADDLTAQRLRGGETLINDNQVSLRRHSGAARGTLSSVFVASQDDVSLNDNQIEIENGVDFFLTNALVLAGTARIESNRMQEKLTGGLLSAISFAILNNTSHNQSTHCILAVGPAAGRVVTHNRSLLDLLPGDRQLCAVFEALAEDLSERIGRTTGIKAPAAAIGDVR
jgi:Family of unknown function (DUF6519)